MSAQPLDSLESRLWSKVRFGDGCWEWTGCKRSTGHGLMRLARKTDQERVGQSAPGAGAHRVAWAVWHGRPVPRGDHYGTACVNHHCDNPSCVRPSHLYVGTQRDNIQDMFRRRRARTGGARGELHGRHKLTSQQVAEIRARYERGRVRQADLAREYGVSQTQVGRIVRGRNWAEGPAEKVQ